MRQFATLSAAVLLGVIASGSVAKTEEACDTPVDMVILSVVHDVERYQAYRSSLIELGTIEKFGGRVVIVATRLVSDPVMFEGQWPDDQHSFVIRWPCEAAAHSFWDSEQYQIESLPLRVGAGQFNVALFPALLE